ncbi:helix-turn-helix domain-containing protein [Salinarchaeum sp. IM2453]|uniref:helix-turn-helix domain-containing protein n=1 Tax=Salinarchaeum sp. IM2453 TaxID=2862870 RepID=UPI002107DCED|nr:helix-turn-helix domain-containing protein [Salinarchaeum sp. IM2453]
MESLKLDMIQYDCPYIRTTRQHDIAFHARHWDFNHASNVLDTRMVAIGADRQELHQGLKSLNNDEMFHEFELLAQQQNTAVIRSRIDETNAMSVIRGHNGYVTGPFVIRGGSEVWNIGFDRGTDSDDALSELERNNEYQVKDDTSIHVDDFLDVLQNIESISGLLRELQNLTDKERDTLETAIEDGYFSSPRDTSLEDLAEEFEISKAGASKNLRRGQRKVLSQVVTILNDLEEQIEMQQDDSYPEPANVESDTLLTPSNN